MPLIKTVWFYSKTDHTLREKIFVISNDNKKDIIYHALLSLLHFLLNWKWKCEMVYEEQNVQWKHDINMLKLLQVYNTA